MVPFFPVFSLFFCSFFSFFPASPAQSRSPSPSPQDTLTLRALVSTKDAGVIIGKAGKNVADLRDQTGVKAGVSKVIPGVHERVLTVTGSVEAVSKVRSSSISLNDLFSYPPTGLQHHYLPAWSLRTFFSRYNFRTIPSHLHPTLNIAQSDGHHHRSQRTQD